MDVSFVDLYFMKKALLEDLENNNQEMSTIKTSMKHLEAKFKQGNINESEFNSITTLANKNLYNLRSNLDSIILRNIRRVEGEINIRLYGGQKSTTQVSGGLPESIDLSKFDTNNESEE